MSEALVCKKCEQEKPIGEFKKTYVKGVVYVRRRCMECERERKRKYYAINREKCIASTKRWQRENPEKAKQSERNHYQKNAEKRRADSRLCRQAKLEKYREREQKYRNENKGKVRESWLKWKSKLPLSYMNMLFKRESGKQYPKELLEVKRLQYMIKNLLKEHQ